MTKNQPNPREMTKGEAEIASGLDEFFEQEEIRDKFDEITKRVWKRDKKRIWNWHVSEVEKTKRDALGEFEITLKPKTDPYFSCPQSVLYLPTVINGIKNGEIIVELNPLTKDQ